MKINKGTVKNINKKLIAGLLAVSLTTGLTGCRVYYGMESEISEGGHTVYVNAKYNDMHNWKVIAFDFNGVQSFYLAEKITMNGKFSTTISYYNIFGGQCLYTEGNENTELSILMEANLTDYLITYDRVQSEYTEQELKDILNQIREDYKQEKDKQLVIGD